MRYQKKHSKPLHLQGRSLAESRNYRLVVRIRVDAVPTTGTQRALTARCCDPNLSYCTDVAVETAYCRRLDNVALAGVWIVDGV